MAARTTIGTGNGRKKEEPWAKREREREEKVGREERDTGNGLFLTWVGRLVFRLMTWDEADDGQVSDDGDWVVGTAKREGKKEWQKIKGERLFFFNICTWFSPPFRTWNPHLFIGVGRGMFGLHLFQILALGSTRKDLNYWFKVGIIGYQICCRGVSWVRYFRAVPPPLWRQLVKTDHTGV